MTRTDAMNATYRQELYHVRLLNRDGTPVRCRVNGQCKTWKTHPIDFRLPVKYGLKECFYITPENMKDWQTQDSLIDDAAKATECFSEDELEAYAANTRKG